ncbi:MAG: sporulation integral membrane protein YtvI [Oscillospiraceae bacterium]|nr:sporulation integral membrane protein YtvI [Oscillospiraceae bacterium]
MKEEKRKDEKRARTAPAGAQQTPPRAQPAPQTPPAGDKVEKRRRFIINFVYVALVLGIVFVVLKYGINIIMPFVVAFAVAMMSRPVIAFLRKKARFSNGAAAVVSVILIYALFGGLVGFLGTKIVLTLRDWIVMLPDTYVNSFLPAFNASLNGLEGVAQRLGPEFAAFFENLSADLTASIGKGLTNLASAFATWVGHTATAVPGFLIKVLITIVSSFFITKDYDLITRFLLLQLSPRGADTVRKIKQGLIGTIGSYLKSYLLIMGITFLELLIGLSIFRVDNAFIISLVIALFDILPVVGCGTILVPWIIVVLIQGKYVLAAELFALWVVITVVRNIIEPKIVGEQVGMHPVLVLFGMVVGTYFFGGVGLLGVPVGFALLKKLHDQGTIGLYRSFDQAPGQTPPAPGDAPREEEKE